jgi:hypothetical protein
MAGTSSEGVGPGSVADIYPKIVNDVVKPENLQNNSRILENLTSDIVISTADGTASSDDAASITIEAGAGYPSAADGVDADGGFVNIYAGAANGNGEGGDINIEAGDTGDGPDANAGDVNIRGGDADAADNSDAGDVNIYGGNASTGLGDSDGGDIRIESGDAGDDGQAGWIFIYAGDSGNGDGSDGSPQTGGIDIYAGSSNASTNVDGGDITINGGNASVNGRGGDVNITAGSSFGTDRGGDINLSAGSNSGAGREGHVYLNSMPRMPVYANATARDAAAGTATNGMFCYNTATGNIEVYVGGAWKSVDVSAIP